MLGPGGGFTRLSFCMFLIVISSTNRPTKVSRILQAWQVINPVVFTTETRLIRGIHPSFSNDRTLACISRETNLLKDGECRSKNTNLNNLKCKHEQKYKTCFTII